MFGPLRRTLIDESGQDLVEYGLLMALIALIAAFGVQTFGNEVADAWDYLATEVPDVIGL